MKLLLADDNEVERTALREIVCAEIPHVEIIETKDGQEALDKLCDGLRPELCLLDIRMPALDGMQLLQRIRRDPQLRNLRVVITSANRDRNQILALAQLGVSGYLLKPYDAAKVRSILQQTLGTLTAAVADPTQAARNLLAKTLLLVDDEKEIRDMLRAVVVAESGWEVVEAQNGEEALLLLRQGLRPTLCFCDLMMPKMDGFGFVRRVREDPALSALPIAIVSSENKVESIRNLAERKIAGYLVKPFDVTKVRALLRQYASPGGAKPADEEPKPENT